MVYYGNFAKFLKAMYFDDFKWSIIKCIGLFALGIRIAQGCKGFELIPE